MMSVGDTVAVCCILIIFCLVLQVWHKGCFKCQVCNMTLNMKNYKGFDKKPYCTP